jgi:hypothetical protein
MFFNNPYSLTPEQRLDCKVKQKGYAKMITKFIRNREYVSGDESHRITFRIVSVLPSKNNFEINDYRLNVEVSKIEYYVGCTEKWYVDSIHQGDKIGRWTMNRYKRYIQKELGMYLLLFGLNVSYCNNGAFIEIGTPKVINRI